jgi:hypothetical protein
MKRTLLILTLAIVLACTKSTVTLDQPEAIAIVPVTAHMTKAAVSGTPEGQDLLIWANYATKGTNTAVGDVYFDRALFAKNGTVWTGKGQDYFWPKSGALTLSGCTSLPEGNGSIAYYYADDTATDDINEANTITVTGYKQSLNPAETVDFLWFNQTGPVNQDRTENNLPITLSHALTWVTIQVQGFGGSIGWNVESIKLKNVKNQGNLTCATSGAAWKNEIADPSSNEFVVYQAPTTGENPYFVLAETAKTIETTPAGTVMIPQRPVIMEVKYHTTGNPTEATLRTKELDLKISDDLTKNIWQAGKHYVYTVTFNPYKITFSVVEDNTWDNTDKNVDEYKDTEIQP